MKRRMSVAGKFYPDNSDEIGQMIARYNRLLDNALKGDNSALEHQPKALIVPHAGYIYSGFTANIAYRAMTSSRPKRFVIIGPSHRVYLEHTSISEYEALSTPYGDLEVDQELVTDLKERFGLWHQEDAHHEHSTETQFPFIKHYFHDAKAVELVYGKIDFMRLVPIIEYLLTLEDVFLLISTDLSHFYTLEKAKQLDNICMNAIKNRSIDQFNQGCEACGQTGVKAITYVANKYQWNVDLLNYTTSADVTQDASSVVGYLGVQYYV
jgi:AmmeMemoRadiSam system protein B